MSRRVFFHLLSAATSVGDPVPDVELLRRFARDRDTAAFELLARRHAPAVWAACRRVLRTEADAEDAFQAAFLVLARKAGAVRGPCVGGWLHRVAVNAALKLRERAARVTTASPDQLAAVPAPDPPDADLAAAVQEELARLPDRYRLPVVLCELEGQTHAEAATALGWPVGTVAGRLSRARALLRDRLARRGLAPAAGGIVAGAAGSPPAGAATTAVAAATGTAPVPVPVSSLAEGVLSAMRTAKLKLTAAVVASAGLLGLAGIGTALAWPRSGPPVAAVPKPILPLSTAAPEPPERPIEGDWLPKKPGDPVPTAFPDLRPADRADLSKSCPRLFGKTKVAIEPTDDTFHRLLKARLHQGVMQNAVFLSRFQAGQYDLREDLPRHLRSLDDVRDTVVELWATDPTALRPWLEELVILAKAWEEVAVQRANAGTDVPGTLNAARRYRLAAEAVLWKARTGKPGGR